MDPRRRIAAVAPAELRLAEPMLDDVAARYADPPRHYHDLAHVAEVATRFAEVERDLGWQHPREVFLAVLYHDAIYVAGATDNEPRSALLARDAIARFVPEPTDAGYVAALIELTARHGELTPDDVDHEQALFLDCDMAILGAPADAFDRYDEGVRLEYAPIAPPAAYRAGRRRFLEQLASRPRLFLSDYFHARLDAAARANLRRAIARSPSPSPSAP